MVFSKRTERSLFGLGAASLISGLVVYNYAHFSDADMQNVGRIDEIESRMTAIDRELTAQHSPRDVLKNLPYWTTLEHEYATLQEEHTRLVADGIDEYGNQLTPADLYGIIASLIGAGGMIAGLDTYLGPAPQEPCAL